MRKLKFALAAVLILCAAGLIVHGVERVNDTPVKPDGSTNIPSDGSRYIPVAGDAIRCGDGSDYHVLAVAGYPDCGPLPSMSQEWPRDELPEGEAIHYEDGSGDYLFLQNMYETLRMAYTVCGESSARPLHIRLTVPEDISSDAFSPWDPERVSAQAEAGRGGIICVEAWDMFRDGVYYKTLYEIGIDRREAECE